MQTAQRFVLIGAVCGFLAVALGAFAAHGLREQLEPGLLQAFRTGVEYQATHALALVLVGLLGRDGHRPLLAVAGWSFAGGILLFSGSLYLLALSGVRWLGAVTPFGGVAFLVGWGALALHALRPAPR